MECIAHTVQALFQVFPYLSVIGFNKGCIWNEKSIWDTENTFKLKLAHSLHLNYKSSLRAHRISVLALRRLTGLTMAEFDALPRWWWGLCSSCPSPASPGWCWTLWGSPDSCCWPEDSADTLLPHLERQGRRHVRHWSKRLKESISVVSDFNHFNNYFNT